MQQVNSIKQIETAINENGDMVVSKNKENNMVIMSIEEYKNSIFSKETERHLLNSEKDIENGRTKNASVFFRELEEKYGF